MVIEDERSQQPAEKHPQNEIAPAINLSDAIQDGAPDDLTPP
jgi:hypothetical protein